MDTNMHSYKSVDAWLGRQSTNLKTALKRLKWSAVYISDALVEVVNWMQQETIGSYNQWVSRVIAAVLVGLVWALPAIIVY